MPIKYNNQIGNDIPDETYWNASTKGIVLLTRHQLCTREKMVWVAVECNSSCCCYYTNEI